MSRSSVLERRDLTPAQDAREGAAQATIELAVYDRLEDVEHEWRRFETSADCAPFQTFDWLATACRHVECRKQMRPAIVIGRLERGETLFLFPLTVTAGAVRRLSFLGSDLCDYNGPLLAPDFSAHVTPERFRQLWRDILRLLQADHRYRHDLIDLTKLPERVGSQANPLLALPVALNPSNAYVADLFGSWDEFYEAKRSSATRRRDRTKLKRLGEFGKVSFVTPQERGEIERTMEVLFTQKARSLARMGAADMFAQPGWREFFTDAAVNPQTRHFVHVSRLDAGQTWAAINLGLTFRDTYYHILASYDDGETARFGPGVAHLRELLRLAIGRGMTHFDFTIGDERYKQEWSDRTLLLFDHVAPASVRGWPAAALTRGHRRLKRFIKQNDTLWSAFSRARAALGSKKPDTERQGAEATKDKQSPPLAPQ